MFAEFFFPLHGQPEVKYLLGKVAPGWIIQKPLEIRIECDEFGDYVVSDSQFAVYGVGADRSTAIADYIVSLVEYFELIEIESRDHRPTASLFHRIQGYIARFQN